MFLGQSAVMTARETADGFAHGNLQKTMQEKLTTIDGAKSQWFVMSDAERTAIATRLYRAGVISAPTYAAAQSKWFDAVEQAAGFYGAGKKVTPWQMLDVFEGGASAGGRGGGGATAGPRTTTSTSKSVDLPTAAQAAEAVKAIFQDKLGRDPDDGELSRYSGIITAGGEGFAHHPRRPRRPWTPTGTARPAPPVAAASHRPTLSIYSRSRPRRTRSTAPTRQPPSTTTHCFVPWRHPHDRQHGHRGIPDQPARSGRGHVHHAHVRRRHRHAFRPGGMLSQRVTQSQFKELAGDEGGWGTGTDGGTWNPGGFTSTAAGNGQRQQVIEYAKKFLGTPYVWGGTTPNGFDCSGLVQYVYKKFGVNLPRVSQQQANAGKRTSAQQPRAR